MDRYFFHLKSTDAYVDNVGSALPSLHAAKCFAVQYLAEHLSHKPGIFWLNEMCEVRVADDKNLTLLVVSLVATLSPAIPTSAC